MSAGLFMDGELLEEHVRRCQERFLQEALQTATSAYWMHRSRQFAGVGTQACDEIAQACRNAAAMALVQVPEQIVCVVCETPTSPWSCSCGETRIEAVA